MPTAASIVAGASVSRLAAGRSRAVDKKRKYEADCTAHNLNFVPLVLEAYGAVHPDLEALVRHLARIRAQRADHPDEAMSDTQRSFLFDKISVKLQSGNARAIIACQKNARDQQAEVARDGIGV
jgi:hypothetical protein